jgi:ATP/maltotriose-dependent transcriptional regulator MalT
MEEMTSVSLHVNREQEIKIFEGMLTGDTNRHIFLVQADAGMGKTSLLKEFSQMCGDEYQWAKVNLKKMSYTEEEILGELCRQLGPALFQKFDRARSDRGPIQSDPGQRRMYRQILTDAFFDDLVSIGSPSERPTVLLFDTFEKASDPVKEWLWGQFLDRARPHQWLVLVLAGRKFPQLDIDLEEWCMKQSLKCLSRDHVRQYVQRLEVDYKSEEVIDVVYKGTKGVPLGLVTFLQNLRDEGDTNG